MPADMFRNMRGFVNILKPEGTTSSDAVVKVRKILSAAAGEKIKTGHLGTLDPLASGVLPIAVGKAARLFGYLSDKTKKYRAGFFFGETTDTLDSTGKTTVSGKRIPSAEEIEKILPELTGDIDQIPPQFSAKSVDGRRAYDYARAGIEVELNPKRVRIDSVSLAGSIPAGISGAGNGFIFEIVCGGGTYIRSIVRDMATKLGTVGFMSSLVRLQSGPFGIEDAVSPKEFEKDPQKYLLPVEYALGSFERYALPEKDAFRVLNGIRLPYSDLPSEPFVLTLKDEIIGIAENRDGFLEITVRL